MNNIFESAPKKKLLPAATVFLFIAVFFLGNTAKAQISDSLYKALPDSLKPKQKLLPTALEKQRLLSYVGYYIGKHNFTELSQIANLLGQEANATTNLDLKIKNGKSVAEFYFMITHSNHSADPNNPKYLQIALTYFKKAVNDIGSNKKYYPLLGKSYADISKYFIGTHQYDSVIEYLHAGIDIATTINDTAVLIDLNQTYGLMYSQLSLPYLAIQYDQKALSLFPANQLWNVEYTRTTINLAIHYLVAFNADNKKQNMDTALKKIYQVMEVKKKAANDWYASCYYVLGLIFSRNGEYAKALPLFDSSMTPAYNQTSKYWPNYQYGMFLQKALCLIKLGQYTEGKKLLDSVKLPKNDFRSFKAKADAMYMYSLSVNDWKAALDHYKEFIAYRDSSDVLSLQGKIFESEQRYRAAQKQTTIEKLQNEQLKDKSKTRGVIIVFLFILLAVMKTFLLFYFNNRRLLKKRRKERRLMIEQIEAMERNMTLQQARQSLQNEQTLLSLRKNISHDMHDEVSGSLAALRFIIKDYTLATENAEAKKILTSLQGEADSVYMQVRNFLQKISSAENAVSFNVCQLLDNLSATFNNKNSLHIDAECDKDFVEQYFTPLQHVESYLFIKEAVVNCMKHADASKISIKVYENAGRVCLNIGDNGKGSSVISGGMGIESMKNRMTELGGTVTFLNDNGFHILGSFPISQ